MSIKEEVDFLKICFQKRHDSRFVKNVMSMGDDSSIVNLVRMGAEQNDVPYYYIAPDATGSGFFADHNRLLCYLYYADYYGLRPVVEYCSAYCYAEKEAVNGTTNPYEYYFCQPADIGLEDLKCARTVLKSRKENAALVGKMNQSGKGYDISERYIDELGRISAKYIRLNDTVEIWMQGQLKKIIGDEKILGVHVRGTDFKRNYKGHPVKVTTDEYLRTAYKVAKEKGYGRVFLATDDADAITKFRNCFGESLFFYEDVVRSNGDETVMKSERNRKDHHYLLGREVLRDAWTLGACDGLVAGLSQVSVGARILKRSKQQSYEDLIIVDKGINLRGDICR